MNQNAQSEKDLEMSQPHYSMIIPFSPAMRNPKLLLSLLTSAGEGAEENILRKYSKEEAIPLINTLRDALRGVANVPEEKTLAIFVTQFSKKVYYFTPTKNDKMPTVRVDNPCK